jgi:hypothetical protein
MIEDKKFYGYLYIFLFGVLGIVFIVVGIRDLSSSLDPLGRKKEFLDYLMAFSHLSFGSGWTLVSASIWIKQESVGYLGFGLVFNCIALQILGFSYTIHPLLGHGLVAGIFSIIGFLFLKRTKRKKE